MPTTPTMFRLSPETLALLDAIAAKRGIGNRTDAVRAVIHDTAAGLGIDTKKALKQFPPRR